MTITDRGRNTHVARLFHAIIIFPAGNGVQMTLERTEKRN
jgi:hypothetical protein